MFETFFASRDMTSRNADVFAACEKSSLCARDTGLDTEDVFCIFIIVSFILHPPPVASENAKLMRLSLGNECPCKFLR